MIAWLAAYALIVQVILAAVGNGTALAHDLDGRAFLCNTIGLVAAPDDADRPVAPELCCVATAVTSAPPPLPVVSLRPVATLRLVFAAPPPTLDAAAPPLTSRARAPPV